MEFKIRANIVMSRELTIEAEGLNGGDGESPGDDVRAHTTG